MCGVCVSVCGNIKKGSLSLLACLPAASASFLACFVSRLCLLLWLAIVEHIWNMCNCFASLLAQQNPAIILRCVYAHFFPDCVSVSVSVSIETRQTTTNVRTLHLCSHRRRYKEYTKTFGLSTRVDGLTRWLSGRQTYVNEHFTE